VCFPEPAGGVKRGFLTMGIACLAGAVVGDRQRQARIDPPSVDQDRAGAALAAVAAFLGAGQVESFAQQVEQRDARIVELDVPLHAIHR